MSFRGALDLLDYKFKEFLLEPEDWTEKNGLLTSPLLSEHRYTVTQNLFSQYSPNSQHYEACSESKDTSRVGW